MAHSRAKKPNSKDVADKAGVSRTTVSFVLNDRPDSSIPTATRERVLAAAESLGYVPSPEARALRMGRSSIVLCLLPDWPITGPLGIFLKQISADLADAGLTMLSHQRKDAEDLSRVLQATTPTAVVAMCDLTAEEADIATRRGLHLTSWMSNTPGYPDEAHLKQSDIGRLQVRTLADLGHIHIAYASPSDVELAWFSVPRASGAREQASELGLQFEEFRLPDTANSSRSLVDSALRSGVTGACAYNDEVAYALITATQDLGKGVPEDLSVIGVDDSAVSRMCRPSIATIAFDLSGEAERLSTLISDRSSAGSKLSTSTTDVIHVVRRESIGVRDKR